MMNPETGRFTDERDAKALRKFFGRPESDLFPPDWPRFKVGKTVCVGGVDCTIADIDGCQLTAMPQDGVWPKLRRFEKVQIGSAELQVWKITRKGIVLRHPKQCAIKAAKEKT